MTRTVVGMGLGVTLMALCGCVAPLPPPAVPVAPPAPAVAVTAPVVLVPVPPNPPPVVHHRAAAPHSAVHHHRHRYVVRRHVLVSGGPYCGSPVRPCNVEHQTVPVQ